MKPTTKHTITMLLASLVTITAAFGQQTTNHPASLEERRFAALAMVESATKAHPEGDDMAIGRDGERSRWQMLESVWEGETTLPFAVAASNVFTAKNVAVAVQSKRVANFVARYHRQPTDCEWALLWQKPSRVLHPKPVESERAQRFANLVASKNSLQ